MNESDTNKLTPIGISIGYIYIRIQRRILFPIERCEYYYYGFIDTIYYRFSTF